MVGNNNTMISRLFVIGVAASFPIVFVTGALRGSGRINLDASGILPWQQGHLQHRSLVSPDDTVYVACGHPRTGKCNNFEGTVERIAYKFETHEVRCCSSSKISAGWRKNKAAGCSVWAAGSDEDSVSFESEEEGSDEDSALFESEEEGSDEGRQCFHASTYGEAEGICEANGARLCTKEEVLSGCTQRTGCGDGSDLVWTQTVPQGIMVEMPWIACGRGQKKGAKLASQTSETAYVRCCSNTFINGWKFQNDCALYTETDHSAIRDQHDNGKCSGLVTYEEAENICFGAGARLCTKEEVLAKCAGGTGCRYDSEFIWTQSKGLVLEASTTVSSSPTLAPTSSPTSPPTKPNTDPPTLPPTQSPTRDPTSEPTRAPTTPPTTSPTRDPTPEPTNPLTTTPPTLPPTPSPTRDPTPEPTTTPLANSNPPTRAPTSVPTLPPSTPPTASSLPPSAHPTAPPTAQSTTREVDQIPSVLPNWDFEQSSISPWYGSSNTILAQSEEYAYSGRYGAVISQRTGTSQGINQDVKDILLPDELYYVSVWAKLVNVSSDDAMENFHLTIYEERSDEKNYPKPIQTYASRGDGITKEWKLFSGFYQLTNAANLTKLRLYFEGPSAGYSFAVDDVVLYHVVEPTPEEYFVSNTENTEHVNIPQPPIPDVLQLRSGCPEEEGVLEDWTTWFPDLTPGQDVRLPNNTRIVITSTVETQLGFLTIPVSSELVFAENPTGIDLNVAGIDCEGTITAGSETCRYATPLTITLHGDRPIDITDFKNRQDPSYKGISVTGRIDLHGKRFYRTWTRLAKRAVAGDTYLYLQDDVNWEPGQEIVLVTTATRDSRDWHQNEVFTISSIQTVSLPDPAVAVAVHLTSPVKFNHIARPEYQGEVGLLTRSIKVQGAAEDSPPTDVSSSTCTLTDHKGQEKSAHGYDQIQCPDTYLTGFGGHIMVHSGGVGYVEGVELFRMGQTNVLGRYPMHFHLLGDGCPGCYLKDSSIHESYYRCISVHATNFVTVSENVAFDVTGFCYYLEDGVEEGNTLSYNLAAHIHVIGGPANGASQLINPVNESLSLTLPADVTASGFYITNLNNTIIGNSASGGWAAFAFPILYEPVGPSRINYPGYNPSLQPSYIIDGNTAHSTAHFWGSAAAYYFGGSLYYLSDGTQQYNPGRDQTFGSRRNDHWNRITNSKIFQVSNVGIGSWSGRMEVVNYEIHDCGLAAEALVAGFWMDNMVAVCRTGETLVLPVQRADYIRGDGFFWYDTGQEHIITDSTFRNCGYRSDEFDQYDSSPSRGCGNHPLETFFGCGSGSTVFGFLTHSDEFNPEIMQGTKNLAFDDVGRRFKFSVNSIESVSGRTQNWYDADGTVSGLNEATIIGSGFETAGKWWNIDEDVEHDVQAPLVFIKESGGPNRGLAHIHLEWNAALHKTTGKTACFNGGSEAGLDAGCPAVGSIRHRGTKYNETNDPRGGLPVTANADIAGITGGYGWLLQLNGGAPRELNISQVEVFPHTPLLLSVAYPSGTTFTIKAKAANWCSPNSQGKKCEEEYTPVDTVDAVFFSIGNVYHFDENTGLLTIRVVPVLSSYTSYGNWKVFDLDDVYPGTDEYIFRRFERNGVILPQSNYGSMINIVADCIHDGIYCTEDTPSTGVSYDDVCSSDAFEQISYDKCCMAGDPETCEPLYPITPAPSASPSEAPSITPCPPRTTNLMPDEGFENGREGDFCYWFGVAADIAIVEGDSYEGSQSMLAYNRAELWAGLWIDVTDVFVFDVDYRFTAAMKILNGNAVNYMQVTLKIHYDLDDDTRSYQWSPIFSDDNIPTDTWVVANTTFSYPSSSMLPNSTVAKMEIYFTTDAATGTVDYLVDAASMDQEVD